MICEVCRESIATVHLIEIVNNTKKDIHLCENCAQQKGVAIHSHVKNLSIPEFFGHLVENPAPATGVSEELSCQMCGITFSEFRSGGKLGCPHDYQVFRRELSQLLEKIQSVSTQHRGRVPTRVTREMGRRQELDGLRDELKKAVSSEEYELAAELRDRIHDLEREEHCN
ncbi:MAG: UvrB/UvrC motif-containing protein [Planctomycetota bacterium]